MINYAKNTIIFGFCTLLIVLGGCSDSTPKPEDQLHIGTNAEYPPYSFYRQDQIVGFDIDIAKEIANRLGMTYKIIDYPFDGLMGALHNNKIDVIAAGLTPTEKRREQMYFLPMHFKGDPLVIVSFKDVPLTLENLKNQKIIVNEGYTADMYLSEMWGLDLIRLNNSNDGFLALRANRGDVFVTAKSTLDDFKRVNPNIPVFESAIPDSSEQYALSVGLSNTPLQNKMITILQTMERDGTLALLQEKWHLVKVVNQE